MNNIEEKGHLGIPKMKPDEFSYRERVSQRAHTSYYELLKKNPDVVSFLLNKREVKELEDQMVSHASGCSIFDINTLAMWYLWAINEYGQEQADEYLDNYLEAENVSAYSVIWVLGLSVKEPCKLDENFWLMPVEALPLSDDKELYLQHGPVFPLAMPKRSKAAFVQVLDFPKVSKDQSTSHVVSTQLLYIMTMVTNALGLASSQPFYKTDYFENHVPPGLFGGYGGGHPQYDVTGGDDCVDFDPAYAPKVVQLAKAYFSLTDAQQQKYMRILELFMQSKIRSVDDDKILDLGIALEMLLLENASDKNQLSLQFRLRGAWLLGQTVEDRKNIYKLLGEIYNFRSEVAHNGRLSSKSVKTVKENYSNYVDIAGRIFQKLIEGPVPDWGDLLLGGVD